MIAISELSRKLARDAIADFQFWMARQHPAQPATQKPPHRRGDNTPIVIAWLKAQTEPRTVEQISEATGIKLTTIREIFRRNRDVFVHAGTIRNGRVGVKLWKAA